MKQAHSVQNFIVTKFRNDPSLRNNSTELINLFEGQGRDSRSNLPSDYSDENIEVFFSIGFAYMDLRRFHESLYCLKKIWRSKYFDVIKPELKCKILELLMLNYIELKKFGFGALTVSKQGINQCPSKEIFELGHSSAETRLSQRIYQGFYIFLIAFVALTFVFQKQLQASAMASSILFWTQISFALLALIFFAFRKATLSVIKSSLVYFAR